MPLGFEPSNAGLFVPSVGSFSSPIAAVGYDVMGTFSLFGQTVETTEPLFFGFLFDEPTTGLPLPEAVIVPQQLFPGSPITFNLPLPFNVENIVVRSVPEPATLLLLGIVASALLCCKRHV